MEGGGNMNPFKEGDKVVCVNSNSSHYLKTNHAYTVGALRDRYPRLVYIKELDHCYEFSRFKLVESCYPTLRCGYCG